METKAIVSGSPSSPTWTKTSIKAQKEYNIHMDLGPKTDLKFDTKGKQEKESYKLGKASLMESENASRRSLPEKIS